MNRAGERLGEARKRGDRREVSELVGGDRVEHGACSHGFRASARSRYAPCPGEPHGGGPGGEVSQTESGQPERGASTPRDGARQIIGGPPRGADNDDFGSGKTSAEKAAGRLEA